MANVGQQLARFENIVIQEAETIEREMLQNLSAEAKLLMVQEADWKHIQGAINKLQQALKDLRMVDLEEDEKGNKIKDGTLIKSHFFHAEMLLTNALATIDVTEAHINTAISMTLAEKNVATTAINKLRDVHSKLNMEIMAIKNYRGW